VRPFRFSAHAAADPPQPSSHVLPKPGRLLIVKSGCPLDELLQGLLGYAESVGSEVVAQEVESLLDAPDGRLLGILFQPPVPAYSSLLESLRKTHQESPHLPFFHRPAAVLSALFLLYNLPSRKAISG